MSLTIEYSAFAQCTPNHIWQVFEQIERWPRWDPQAINDVRWVSGSPWTKGARFTIHMQKPMSFKLTPEIMDVEPPIYVHLRGEGKGISGEQFYIFRWIPDNGNTEVRTMQQFAGATIKLLGKSMKPAIEAGIRHLVSRVVQEAEGLARLELSSPIPGMETAREPVHDPGDSNKPPAGDPMPDPGDVQPPPLRDPSPNPDLPGPPAGDPPDTNQQ